MYSKLGLPVGIELAPWPLVDSCDHDPSPSTGQVRAPGTPLWLSHGPQPQCVLIVQAWVSPLLAKGGLLLPGNSVGAPQKKGDRQSRQAHVSAMSG